MYEGLIMLDRDSEFSVEAFQAELERTFLGKPGAPSEIAVQGSQITLQWGAYALRLHRSAGPNVLEESAEIAESCGEGHPERERIAECRVRFELVGDEDPELNHLPDALLAGEAAARCGRVYRFDEESQEFLDLEQ